MAKVANSGLRSGIYKITNIVNGKFYIGSSTDINRRWNRHKLFLSRNNHGNPYLQNAFIKHGKDNFKFEILELCPADQLISKEQYYIDLLDAVRNGYNICSLAYATTGITYKQTEEHKRKIGLKSKERHLSEETKQKLSKLRTGSKLSTETKEKIRISLLGNKRTLGRKASPETRLKMSLAHSNISDETRQKLSAANKNRIHSPETRRKISLALTGKSHPHKGVKGRITSEETKLKISKANIGRVISEKVKRIISATHKGKIVSVETRKKLSIARLRTINSQKEAAYGAHSNCNNISEVRQLV